MGKDMNLSVRPTNELAVAPDPIRFGELVHEGLGLGPSGWRLLSVALSDRSGQANIQQTSGGRFAPHPTAPQGSSVKGLGPPLSIGTAPPKAGTSHVDVPVVNY